MAVYGMTYENLVRIYRDIGYGQEAVTDLAFDDFDVVIRKTGQGFSEKVLTPSDVVDLGDGWYVFKWSVSDMDSIGQFYYSIMPILIGGIEVTGFNEVLPPPQYANNVHPTCIVTGNIVDISGIALVGTPIIFRAKNVPVFAGPSILGATRVPTYPDAFGNFSIELLRNVQVLVEIESAGIRHLITVPDLATAPITSLLPPVPPAL